MVLRDGWGSVRQADSGEEGLNGCRLSEGGDDGDRWSLHVTWAGGTHGDIVFKNSRQQLGPGNTMGAGPTCGVVLTAFGLRQCTRANGNRNFHRSNGGAGIGGSSFLSHKFPAKVECSELHISVTIHV